MTPDLITNSPCPSCGAEANPTCSDECACLCHEGFLADALASGFDDADEFAAYLEGLNYLPVPAEEVA